MRKILLSDDSSKVKLMNILPCCLVINVSICFQGSFVILAIMMKLEKVLIFVQVVLANLKEVFRKIR